MSYVLYSAIARAGGIDLYLGTEGFSHPPLHRRVRRSGPSAGLRLRRAVGQVLIRSGRALTAWGAKWAPACNTAAFTELKAAR